MPAETFSKPLEGMLNDKCSYEYYYHINGTYSKTQKTRICHIALDIGDKYNQDVVLMVFTVRNQSGKWKIHSEGAKRTDPGSTVPLRNKAIELAKSNGWKYASIAIAGEDVPENEVVSQYVVSMESYDYGNETVYDLTNELQKLDELGLPDFYRCEVTVNGNTYSFAFIKKEKFVDYIAYFDNRPYDQTVADESDIIDDKDIFAGFEPWLTTYNNPDYTGKEKYLSYPRSLKRLINFMFENELIEDTNLNELDLDKYLSYIEIYDNSDEVRDFDKKNNSSRGGIAALKKYVKYIEYLINGPIMEYDYNSTKGSGINKIFYGTPGCGKSYHIDHEILGKDKETKEYIGEYEKDNIIRTTFYQDYSNADFVGQILPKVVKGGEGEKDTVEYIFNPGPFTLALIRAISNPSEKVALVIEEINRGNAPAIFGDIFQLLDRDDDSISEYGIVNVSLIDYLNDLKFVVNGQKKQYLFTEIKIPGNLDIFATMNTSDQNVYTLDTAFVRRWEKEKIKNSFDQCTFAETAVPGMPNYTWKEFVDGINGWIARHLEDLQVNEDKQIGVFFVKESLLTSGDAEKFAFKVFDYLWSDVAKLDHGIFFNSYDTLEKLINGYKDKGVGVFKPGIFEIKPVTLPQSEANNEQ